VKKTKSLRSTTARMITLPSLLIPANCEDLQTGKQETLKTRDKAEAFRLVAAKNETVAAPAFSLHLARVYWKAGDPAAANRTWQCVMDEILKLKSGNTHQRWVTAIKDKAFDSLRNLVVMETRTEHFLRALENGTVCTNIFLRRVQNFALDMSWLPWPVLPKKGWPKIQFKDKRGITRPEHEKILAGEQNSEWQAFYNLLWNLGGSQSDVANLRAEDVDWEMKAIGFTRMKNGSVVHLHFGKTLENILNDLPGEGFLLPRIAPMKESDRAKAFMRRCDLVGVSFERIALPWAQSEMTMTLSLGEFAGRKCDACAISAQSKNEVRSANATRRDQRAFRCGVTRARRGRRMKNAVAFASVSGTAAVVAFRFRSSRLSACASLFRPPNR